MDDFPFMLNDLRNLRWGNGFKTFGWMIKMINVLSSVARAGDC